MQAVEERVCDQPVLKLLRAMLRAGVMEDGQVRRPDTGAAQGGVISPVMCKVYLHRLDRAWDDADGVLVRFADDLVVMCWSRSQAEAALARLTAVLAGLGLEPKAAKTRIVHLEAGGEGFDFLGFHHRLVRSRGLGGKPRVTFLARWPSDRAMQHARDRIRDLTGRRRLAGAVARADRGGHQPVPARLGGLLQVRPFSPAAQHDQAVRADAARAVRQQEAPPQPQLRVAGSARLDLERVRPDPPVRNHRCTQGGQALAGKAECRR